MQASIDKPSSVATKTPSAAIESSGITPASAKARAKLRSPSRGVGCWLECAPISPAWANTAVACPQQSGDACTRGANAKLAKNTAMTMGTKIHFLCFICSSPYNWWVNHCSVADVFYLHYLIIITLWMRKYYRPKDYLILIDGMMARTAWLD